MKEKTGHWWNDGGPMEEDLISQNTYDKIDTFLDEYPEAEFGPAHIVLSDLNIMDVDIKWSIGLAKAALSKDPNDLIDKKHDIKLMEYLDWYSDDDPETLKATIGFLEELLKVPEDDR